MRRSKHPQCGLSYEQGDSLARFLMHANLLQGDRATVELTGVGVSMTPTLPRLFFCPIAHASFNPQTLVRSGGVDSLLLIPSHVIFAPDTARIANDLWHRHGYLRSMSFRMIATADALHISNLRIGKFIEMPSELAVGDPGAFAALSL